VRSNNRSGPAYGIDRAIIESIHPWHRGAVIEANHELGAKIDVSRPAHHDAHEVGGVSRRHEVDNRGDTGLGLKFGFEDESAGTITPAEPRAAAPRAQ